MLPRSGRLDRPLQLQLGFAGCLAELLEIPEQLNGAVTLAPDSLASSVMLVL
jgi:hypothetical protein